MSYTLIARNSLHELLEEFDAYRGDEAESPELWIARESLLIVQSSHLSDWLTYRQTDRRGVHFAGQTLLSDQGIRFLLEVFLLACGDCHPELTALARVTMLHTDSLSLLVFRHLTQAAPQGLLGDWLGAEGRRQLDCYSLARDIADAFNSYSLNQGDLDEAARKAPLRSFDTWQVQLWRELFPPTASVMPMGLVLHKVLAVLRQDSVGAAVRARLASGALLSASGRPLEHLAVFGSAFLPLLCLEFLHELGQLAGSALGIEHFLLVPFRAAEPGSPDQGLSTTIDSWAGLGDGLLARLGELGVPGLESMALAGTAREPVWNSPTIRVIACPNRRREVEVLKEEILARLDTDPGLEPNRMAVLCPDPEQYRPLIEAIFPSRSPGERPSDDVPWHFLDTASDPSDFEAALALILNIPGSSLGRSTVSALLGRSCFCRAFGLDHGDVELIRTWIEAGGARDWLDGEHRRQAGLPADNDGTWRALLERLGLGLVYGSDLGLGSRAPLPVGMTGSSCFGKFLRVLNALGQLARGAQWSELKSVEDWGTQMRSYCLASNDLSFDEGEAEGDGREGGLRLLRADDGDKGAQGLSRAISAMVQRILDIDAWGKDVKVDFPLYRAMLVEHLEGQVRGGGQALLQGICIARFQPFRLVPFEHIFCLGMDEGAFPASEERRSLYQFIPGAGAAKNQRPQDLYSFLETLSTYQSSLTILYQGRDPGTRTQRLPAAPVAALAAAAPHRVKRLEAGLHGFDLAELPADLINLQVPWAPYLPEGIRNERHRRILTGPQINRLALGPDTSLPYSLLLDTRDLDDLFRSPLRFYGRKRLGIKLSDEDDTMADDALQFAPERWDQRAAANRVLGAYFSAVSEEAVLAEIRAELTAIVRKGTVARGHFFDASLEKVLEQGRRKYQALDTVFASDRIVPLADFLHQKTLGAHNSQDPLAVRLPPYQAASFGELLSVSGFSGPWLVRTNRANPEIFTLEDLGGEKPSRSDYVRILGRLFSMAAWLATRLPSGDAQRWQLGCAFLVRKGASTGINWAAFRPLTDFLVFLPAVEAYALAAWQNPLPLFRDMFDDADLYSSLCGDAEAISNDSSAPLLALDDYFAQNSTYDNGGFSPGIPGNCPYFRLFYGPALGPLGYKAAEAPGLVGHYVNVARLANFLGTNDNSQGGDANDE